MATFPSDPGRTNGGRENLLAVGILVLSMVLLYLPGAARREIAAAIQGSVLRPFLATQEMLVRLRARAASVDRLESRIDSLVSILSAQRTVSEENRRLRELLGLTPRAATSSRVGTVTRSGTMGSESMFFVDIGKRDGVAPGAPVLTGEGLVGVIREVRDGVSIGMDWTHPDFAAGVMTADGSYYGLVTARRGAFKEDDRLILDGIPYQADLAGGTLIVTSGRGGVYPRGIPVGTVERVAESELEWRRSYWIRPAVAVGSVTHVHVALEPLDDLPYGPLEESADSVASAGTGR